MCAVCICQHLSIHYLLYGVYIVYPNFEYTANVFLCAHKMLLWHYRAEGKNTSFYCVYLSQSNKHNKHLRRGYYRDKRAVYVLPMKSIIYNV